MRAALFILDLAESNPARWFFGLVSFPLMLLHAATSGTFPPRMPHGLEREIQRLLRRSSNGR